MSNLTYGSVCSGIEAASVAWEPLGLTPAWFSEIETFPSAILAHHWPHVANLGDMTKIAERIKNNEIHAPDILVGGTPCQAFSISGLRKGLKDERGQLTLSYVELANEIDRKRIEQNNLEAIIVWENVPGVFSSKDNAFGCFLAALAGEVEALQPPGKRWSHAGIVCGPQRAVAWRVLDAQFYGLAQRRQRVFVVASARQGFDPGKVLFEFEGVRWHSSPRGETQKGSTASAANSPGKSRSQGDSPALTTLGAGLVGALDTHCGFDKATMQSTYAGHLIPAFRQVAFGEYAQDGTASTCKARDCKGATDLVVESTYCIASNTIGRSDTAGGNGKGAQAELSYTLDTSTQSHSVANGFGVRRLLPMECERLQGFPDDHTKIPYGKKPVELCPDGPRYQALGNSMATRVMGWIGQRILNTLAGYY